MTNIYNFPELINMIMLYVRGEAGRPSVCSSAVRSRTCTRRGNSSSSGYFPNCASGVNSANYAW